MNKSKGINEQKNLKISLVKKKKKMLEMKKEKEKKGCKKTTELKHR